MVQNPAVYLNCEKNGTSFTIDNFSTDTEFSFSFCFIIWSERKRTAYDNPHSPPRLLTRKEEGDFSGRSQVNQFH